MNDTEIKEWQTQSVKHKVAMVLIMDGVSFSYTEEDGIVFTAPECYVARLIRRLMSCYGCSVRPNINEVTRLKDNTEALSTAPDCRQGLPRMTAGKTAGVARLQWLESWNK